MDMVLVNLGMELLKNRSINMKLMVDYHVMQIRVMQN